MAYYLCGPDGKIDPDLLQLVVETFDVHTFLIRDPSKQVSSLYKMSTEQEATTGWNTFDPKEVGYAEMKTLMDAVRIKEGGKPPVIVDADDLLADPEKTLRSYCEAI